LGDIIRFQDKFYVLASSSLADNRTRVLKYGETFGVFNVAIEAGNTVLRIYSTMIWVSSS
jgi:hypothetical protein